CTPGTATPPPSAPRRRISPNGSPEVTEAVTQDVGPTGESSLGYALIRFISGSTSGSVATVAAMRRSKYWISIRVPSVAVAGSRAYATGAQTVWPNAALVT